MSPVSTTLFANILECSYSHAFLVMFSSLLLLLKLISFLFDKLRLFRCISKIPQIQQRPVILYWCLLRMLYKLKKEVRPTCYIFQLMCGLCKLFEKDRITVVWIWIRPIVFLFKPETVEAILSSSSTINKSNEYGFLHPWLGKGLLTSTGSKWKRRRKLLTPTFHFRILEDFIPVYNQQSQILVEKMKKLTNKEWIDIVPLITMCTLEIICETTMDVRINAQHDTESEYVKAVYDVGQVFIYRVVRPWLWTDSIFFIFPSGRQFLRNLKTLHGFSRKVIKEKKEHILQQAEKHIARDKECEETAPWKRKAFLELLLDIHLKDPSFTEEDIREEVDTFMFEGHDTTAMAISWSLHCIGLYPDIQKNIFNELDSIFDGDKKRPITQDDLKEMKYLDIVLKESLRLYPSVPFIARELKEDIVISGYTITPGSLCLIFPTILHRDPEIYPNPEKFDPERFLPENCAGRHPYAYIPFSAGPRNCIGQRFAIMEEKTIIANILRNFKVRSLDDRDKILVVPDLILRNVNPLRIQLLPR